MSTLPNTTNRSPESVLGEEGFLRIVDVSKKFGEVTVVDRLSLSVRRKEFFALLGSSGCGKSTLLRIMAGLETPSSGRVILDGQDITDLPAHRRPVNMMFQSYALFPHMNVSANVAYGLKREGVARPEREERVRGGERELCFLNLAICQQLLTLPREQLAHAEVLDRLHGRRADEQLLLADELRDDARHAARVDEPRGVADVRVARGDDARQAIVEDLRPQLAVLVRHLRA